MYGSSVRALELRSLRLRAWPRRCPAAGRAANPARNARGSCSAPPKPAAVATADTPPCSARSSTDIGHRERARCRARARGI